MAKPMTFGTFPSHEEFEQAFDAKCPFGFRLEHGSPGHAMAPGLYDCHELWRELHDLTEREGRGDWDGPEDKGPGTWASSVMGQLGFEWI